MKKLIQRLICRLRGHNYPGTCFSNFQLSVCRRCGKEVTGRTFDDILSAPDDYDDLIDDPFYQNNQERQS